jgi:hypothetical protein
MLHDVNNVNNHNSAAEEENVTFGCRNTGGFNNNKLTPSKPTKIYNKQAYLIKYRYYKNKMHT